MKVGKSRGCLRTSGVAEWWTWLLCSIHRQLLRSGCARRYVCALTSCMLQASYLLLVEKSGAEKGIGSTELLYYNALLSPPFILMVGPFRWTTLA